MTDTRSPEEEAELYREERDALAADLAAALARAEEAERDRRAEVKFRLESRIELGQAIKDRDSYRIEADCGLRDFDNLEVDLSEAQDALAAALAREQRLRADVATVVRRTRDRLDPELTRIHDELAAALASAGEPAKDARGG